MKTSTWSFVGYIIGSLFSFFSAIRYFLLFPDTDRAIVYIGIGIIICALAWLYNRQLELGNSLTAIEDYLSDKNDEGRNRDGK